jgi:predicted transcriptional regulator
MRPRRNPTRQQVLAVCSEQPAAPSELAEKLDRGINATYLAVSDLERSGLIRRDDRGRYYAVEETESSSDEAECCPEAADG